MTQHTPVRSWIRYHVIHVLTSHDSHQYASGSRCERLCACELSRGGVICERAHQWHQSIIGLFDNSNLPIEIKCWLWAVWGVMNDELIMSCIIWFLSMRLVRWEGNHSTTSITLLITRDWGWCTQVSCLWWMPGCYRMYGGSSLVVIGESSFKIGLYLIHYDLQTLYTSKRI